MCSVIQVKYPLLLSEFNKTIIFSAVFRKILNHQISLKSVQREPSCSMRTDGRTDGHDDANSRFSDVPQDSKHKIFR